MFMDSKVSKEEWEGYLKRHGFGISEACNAVLLKTAVVIRPQSVRTHLERYGHLSPAYSAVFRFLFAELQRSHGQIVQS